MWKYIERLVKEEKITVILTTHYMEEADSLCNRVGIIDKGQIIALDNPLKLKESVVGGERVIVKFKDRDLLSANDPETIKKFSFVHKIENSVKENNITVYVDNANYDLPAIIKEINKWNTHDILSIDFRISTLNDVFLKFTGRHISDLNNKDGAEGGFMERYAQYGK